MTEAEKNEIVGLVMTEISSQAVDFDIATEQPQANDLLTAVRENGSGGYRGVTIKWDDVARIATELANQAVKKAEQAKNDAVTAKNIAQEILTGVQNKGAEITNFVATSKSEIETQKNEAVETVRGVYKDDLNAESTARQTADNTLQQNIDSEASTRAEADTAIGARIDTETSTRESEVAELERVNAIQKYEIENLKAKAEGKIYREEIIEANAYKLDVPSSVSPYAELQKIGGKSVVWNQLRQSYNIRTEYGITVSSNGDGTINIQGTVTSTPNYSQLPITESINFKRDGRKYLITSNLNVPNRIGVTGHGEYGTKDFIFSRSEGSDWKGSVYIKVTEGDVLNLSNLSINIIDLTQMFGSGNEPTLEECKKIFTEDYYPYDAGSLKSFPVQRVKSLKADGTEIGSIDISSLTADLKSAGSVHDEWSNGKVTKRVGVVDMGTLDYSFSTDGNGKHFFTTRIDNFKSSNDSGSICKTLSKIFTPTSWNIINWTDATKNLIATYMGTIGFFYVPLADSTDVNAFKSAMLGVMLYYELDTPTEYTVTEIDNFIQVEGGGTLTFESDATISMPVPSTTRFVVDLT